ncbi:hypothetical protein NLD30_08810 [SCandidatus Aminicenantes bacterium Aminicenantia_JdfR_composite]|jgi:hypothetical protein|nr:hypothetical protein [SCandidatus Aminicenantes bacterium Aminicenantia_JdfR_composite]MCP2620827.1 hypothetical protein [Candidatus Aminicenantes bacterium AC-334-E05]
MKFFFLPDKKNNFKFLSEEVSEIKIKSKKWQKLWNKAKNALTKPIPAKFTTQEKAFTQLISLKNNIEILYPESISNKKIKSKFKHFLYKERTKHIILLVAECILLPLSGFVTPIPGPNIIFYALIFFIILHWQALRGINKLLKKNYKLIPDASLNKWYIAIKQKSEDELNIILKEIENNYGLKNLNKVLL